MAKANSQLIQRAAELYGNLGIHAKVLFSAADGTYTVQLTKADGTVDTRQHLSESELSHLVQQMEIHQAPATANTEYGLLTWVSIKEGTYDVTALHRTGNDIGIPPLVLKGIKGLAPMPAWNRATNIPARGIKSLVRSTKDTTSYYMSEDTGGRGRSLNKKRIIYLVEVDDSNQEVSTEQLAVVSLQNDEIYVEIEQYLAEEEELLEELLSILQGMDDRYNDYLYRVDAIVIRKAIYAWLEYMGRVSIKGNGGVFLIPAQGHKYEMARENLLNLGKWMDINNIGSCMSITLVSGDKAVDMDALRMSAEEEVRAQLDLIKARILDIKQNMSTPGHKARAIAKLKKEAEALSAKIGDIRRSLTGFDKNLSDKLRNVTKEINDL